MQGTNVGLYWDSDCANAASQISWGDLVPGQQKPLQYTYETTQTRL